MTDTRPVLRTLPDPDEHRPEHCGRPAGFKGWDDPFGMLFYVYECACGWEQRFRRMYKHPETGRPYFGLGEILEDIGYKKPNKKKKQQQPVGQGSLI